MSKISSEMNNNCDMTRIETYFVCSGNKS